MVKRAQRFVALAVMLVLAAILGGGCHDPFSNQWFEDDELFLAAVPDAERVTTRVPNAGGAERRDSWGDDAPPLPAGNIAEFALWTYDASVFLNEFIFVLLYVVELVTAEPIAWRSEDVRWWGPFATETDDVIWFKMQRNEDRFDYWMTYSGPDDDPGVGLTPFSGTFFVGAVPREGQGSFVYDFGVAYALLAEPDPDASTAGRMFVDHDNRNGQVLLTISFVGLETPDAVDGNAQYAFFLDPSGSGWFEYASYGDVEGSDPDVLERYEVRTRWQADGAGRGDARISEGDLGPLEYRVSECWNTSYERIYYEDNTGYTELSGDPDLCVYTDEELPSHL